jgi:hypothetical protein
MTATRATEAVPGAPRAGAINGAAMAAFLGAGFGTFAMGFFVILNEVGLFVAPTLYGPAGGVSGRTTLATAVWLLGWGVLHARWKARSVEPRRVFAATLGLIALGLVLLLPPVWGLLS